MLSNYLKIAFRNLKGRPGPTVINFVGLASGLAACLLIGLWVDHELSYDEFHPEADRIHRIATHSQVQDQEVKRPMTGAPLAPTIADNVPEVEHSTHFLYERSQLLRVSDRSFPNQRVVLADSSFFDVFGGFEVLHGSRASALTSTDAIVLTESTAKRLFGTVDALGETLEAGGTTQRVTAVIADVPDASHLHFDAISALELPGMLGSLWVSNSLYTYAKLVPDASVSSFESKLNDLVEKYVAPQIKKFLGLSFSQFNEQGGQWAYFTQPITSIHLHSNLEDELEPNGSIAYVYTFSAIALFILLIACVNFMNLATARASERATEVGMRKSLGANRSTLAIQFLGEALLTTSVATLLALLLAALALPAFNDLADTSLSSSAFLDPVVLLVGFAVMVVVGCVAGSYPAFALSRFEPARVLKASDRHSSGGDQTLRRALVIFQFTVSIALIAGTLVVQQQFDYIQNKRLGLNKDNVVVLQDAPSLGDQQNAFTNRVEQLPAVQSAAAGDELFGETINTVFYPDDAPRSESQSLNYLNVGYGFLETMGIELVAGRTFDPSRPADSTAVLLNQKAVDALGWSDPLEHSLREPQPDGDPIVREVIGVVRNFHYESMRSTVQPLVIRPAEVLDHVYVHTDSGANTAVVNELQSAWSQAVAGKPFQYAFLDRTYEQLHRDTQRTGRLFSIFTGFAVLIACLGLFGLATYTARRRTKEIGIRKALGATASQIVGLLSKEFLQLVAVAFVVAFPISYFSMQTWLQDFAYRVDLGITVFLVSGVLATLVAFVTVSYHAIRAAQVDPASSLRQE